MAEPGDLLSASEIAAFKYVYSLACYASLDKHELTEELHNTLHASRCQMCRQARRVVPAA